MKNVFNGFKEFVLRGNAIDLAVGVVIGAAFSQVVNAIVEFIINPIIGAIFGKPDISGILNITLRAGDPANGVDPTILSIGGFLNAILQFLIVAAALYFIIVMPMNHLAARRKKGEEAAPAAPAEDVLVLQEIRDLLAAQNARSTDFGGPGER
ncbi:large conductance mechanosensitive channel protein MscL [Oerskovia sp. KBS0722]|uniref:large conductance mechanosensitive channel protein MscL n=1 Tax=Oerskovia sp. KBS0722 TaxID=1179673 RepID=UPI00110F2ECD|nr:large conductance mechanosensitive channel protein MscL [Oerskovia sp. KBS0722]QDW64341.1 large conductance mechanosensitive channel protein MscL [Oerskovia sp. KBS0722]